MKCQKAKKNSSNSVSLIFKYMKMNNTIENKSVQQAALIMVLLNAFTTPLMLSATNVALPRIAEDLNLDAVMLGWIPMAFLMASAMFVLVFGRVADMVGRKRIFLIGTASVIISSLLASMATNGALLISARFLQGVSAAMLYATQIAIISSVFPPQQRGRAIGMTVSIIYLGLTCGPLLGGFLIDLYGWRASFVFHIPLAIVVFLIGLFKVPGEWSADARGEFDIKGAVLYGLSILLLCIGVSTLPETSGFLLLILGLSGVWAFIKLEKRLDHPIFDVSLFVKNRVFAFSCFASFIIYTAVFANIVLISLYLQYLKGMSATMAGAILMIQPLTMAILSPFAGRLSDNIEPRVIASIGMALTAFGLLMLGLLNAHSSISFLIGALVVTGFGFSLFSSPNANAIMSAVEKQHYGSATGSLATMRILGQMMSMALVTLVFAVVIGQVKIEPAVYQNLQQAINFCFFVSASLCIPGFIFSLVRGRMHQSVAIK
jgi:EmrB/QacA subfamily drug resistance transporter